MKQDHVLVHHERIHLQQQQELFILPFYVLYFAFYLVNLARYRGHHKAYMAIAFEREAYANDQKESYLETRRPYAWLRYIKLLHIK